MRALGRRVADLERDAIESLSDEEAAALARSMLGVDPATLTDEQVQRLVDGEDPSTELNVRKR